ncbi:YnbE family lipoprotein [Novosphingobium sediminis]
MAGTRRRLKRLQLAAVLVAGSMLTGGCITVKAPDKPIVIELNINIKQEVVYRLAGDASQTIDKNKDIF